MPSYTNFSLEQNYYKISILLFYIDSMEIVDI